jgi:hypothetical protein
LIDFDDTPAKDKKKGRKSKSKSKSRISDESDAYTGSAVALSDGSDTDDAMPLYADDLSALTDRNTTNGTPKRANIKPPNPKNTAGSSTRGARYRNTSPLSPIQNTKQMHFEGENPVCSLCGIRHGDGACYMTESSENLAEYRQMLILHADDEPMEDRVFIYTFLYAQQLTPTYYRLASGRPRY